MNIIDEILNALAQPRSAVVYLLGGTDTGKTTLTAQIANQLSEHNIAILDGDIGQSGVLPLTLSLLRVERQFSSLSELPIVSQEFIPGYDLLHNLERNARSLGNLAQEARTWAQYCLVDTTGFIEGPGVDLKRREIEEVKPDLIVALHRSQEVEPILKGIKQRWMQFRVPCSMGSKSEEERRQRRYLRLSSYFQHSSLTEIRVKGVPVPFQCEGRIVGLYGKRFLGLGVVKGIHHGKLHVLTPVAADPQRVEFTSVRFNPTGVLPKGH